MTIAAGSSPQAHSSTSAIYNPAIWPLARTPAELVTSRWMGLFPNDTGPQRGAALHISVDGEIIELSRTFNPSDDIAIDTGPVVRALDYIRDNLALSMTQLAELFGVTRKSVYDWYDGAAPRNNTFKRIHVLRDVIADNSAAADGLRQLKSVWDIEINGNSFRSLLDADNLDDAEMRVALNGKLNELSSRMVPITVASRRGSKPQGKAWLVDIERSTDG